MSSKARNCKLMQILLLVLLVRYCLPKPFDLKMDTLADVENRVNRVIKALQDYVERKNATDLGRLLPANRKFSAEAMLNLYQKLQAGHALHQEMAMPNSDKTDTVRSFSPTGNPKGNLIFKVHPLPPTEILHRAEIHIDRKVAAEGLPHRIKITLERGQSKLRSFNLRIQPRNLREHSAFDITRYIRPWLEGHNGNISLTTTVKSCSKHYCGYVPENSTYLITFTQNDKFLPKLFEYSTVSNSSDIDQNDMPSTRVRRETRKRNRRKRKLCSSKRLMVDFNYMGWGKYIVIPKQYNAKICRGSCPSPIKAEFSPTNHALLQSLMRLRDRKVPQPCCVPTKLLPLSMLYYEGDEVVIRHHADMVVGACGCR